MTKSCNSRCLALLVVLLQWSLLVAKSIDASTTTSSRTSSNVDRDLQLDSTGEYHEEREMDHQQRSLKTKTSKAPKVSKAPKATKTPTAKKKSSTNEDPCTSFPCLNGGTCDSSANDGSFICTCTSGFVGQTCDTVDPCSSFPCLNGGTCDSSANDGSFTCACTAMFAGSLCELANQCASFPCANDATCTADPSTGNFNCDCTGTGFTGVICTVIIP